MNDARTGAQWWYQLLDQIDAGLPVPPIVGGDDPPAGDPETVSKEEYDRLKQIAERRDGLLRKAQKDLATLREETQAIFDALGIDLPDDPEERKAKLDELRAERERARAGKTLAKDEVDRLLTEREKKHQKDLEAVKTLAERRLQRLREVLIDNEATRAAAELGATEGGLEAVRMKIAAEADIVEEDGELRAVIKGKDGPRLGAKGSEPMSIRERVEEIANDQKYGSWFKSTGRPGGGTPASQSVPASGGIFRVTRAQLADPEFYKQHRDKIQDAQRNGTLQITG